MQFQNRCFQRRVEFVGPGQTLEIAEGQLRKDLSRFKNKVNIYRGKRDCLAVSAQWPVNRVVNQRLSSEKGALDEKHKNLQQVSSSLVSCWCSVRVFTESSGAECVLHCPVCSDTDHVPGLSLDYAWFLLR